MDPLGIELAIDARLTVVVLVSVLAGTVLGLLSGLVPGLHANNFALVLASVAPSVPAPALAVGAAMLAAGVVHSFLNAIPALALGVPDAEMAPTALPGHRLVLAGRGREAIRLSALGSGLAVTIALPLAVPITFLMEVAYPYLRSHIRLLLFGVVVGLLATERTHSTRAVGGATFLASGLLGWFTLDRSPEAPLAAGGVLAPLFAGLFGAPMLIEAARGGGVPPQEDPALRSTKGRVAMTAGAGAVAGALVGYLPGISAAIAAVAVLVLMPGGVDDRGYVIATSGVDTANAIFALFALVTIGQPRTGVLVAVESASVPLNLPVLVVAVLFAGVVGTVAVLAVGDVYLRAVASADYVVLCGGALVFLVVLSGLFAGFAGVGIFLVATAIGLVPVWFGAYRVHCMGVLIGPLLVWG